MQYVKSKTDLVSCPSPVFWRQVSRYIINPETLASLCCCLNKKKHKKVINLCKTLYKLICNMAIIIRFFQAKAIELTPDVLSSCGEEDQSQL